MEALQERDMEDISSRNRRSRHMASNRNTAIQHSNSTNNRSSTRLSSRITTRVNSLLNNNINSQGSSSSSRIRSPLA